MDTKLLKPRLKEHCIKVLEERVATLEQEIALIVEDLAEDNKSSAGDKFETSREMANIERQKLADQLEQNNKSLGYLRNLKYRAKDTVEAGALVETDSALIYVAVSLGIVDFEKMKIMVISPNAPLSQAMLGARSGDEIRFSNRRYVIKTIG